MIVVGLEVTVVTEGGLDQDPGQDPDPVTGDPETDLTPGQKILQKRQKRLWPWKIWLKKP